MSVSKVSALQQQQFVVQPNSSNRWGRSFVALTGGIMVGTSIRDLSHNCSNIYQAIKQHKREEALSSSLIREPENAGNDINQPDNGSHTAMMPLQTELAPLPKSPSNADMGVVSLNNTPREVKLSQLKDQGNENNLPSAPPVVSSTAARNKVIKSEAGKACVNIFKLILGALSIRQACPPEMKRK